MTTRSRTQSILSRADEVEYFLCIEGLSPQCRWQELKDVIRKIPPDGHIRQAYTDNENGTNFGHITILSERKAYDTYDYFFKNGWRGRSVRVTLAVRDGDEVDHQPLRRLRGPEEGSVYSAQRFHPPTENSCSHQSSALLPPPVSPVRSIKETFGRASNAMYRSLQPTAVRPAYQTGIQVAAQPVIPLQAAAHAYNSYTASTVPASTQGNPQPPPISRFPTSYHQNSLHRSVREATAFTTTRDSHCANTDDNERRTVYVYNLPYTISQQAIKEHLAAAGIVDRCVVKEDRQRSPKHKLTAVVTFRTPQQAQTAINQFNRTIWKGCEVKVKLDRGPNLTGGPVSRKGKSSAKSRVREDRRETREGPLVVNGSGPKTSSRQARGDSDDESSCDDEE